MRVWRYLPSSSMIDWWQLSGSIRGVELADEPAESFHEAWVILVRACTGEVDDLSVAIGGLLVFASGLVDHAGAVPSVMNVWEVLEEEVRDAFGLVELSGGDEIDGGVGLGREFVLIVVVVGEDAGDLLGDGCPRHGGDERAPFRHILVETTALVFLAAATGAGIIASRHGHQVF